jgi:anti-sigma factor RsiW
MRDEDELIEAYLLGELDGEDRSAVEERMFPDDEFFTRIQFHEDQLIDAYVLGKLSGARKARFEAHFLASPRRQRRLEVVRALKSHFAQEARMEAGKSPWTRIREAFGSDAPMARLAFASCALAVLFGGLSIWLATSLSREREMALRQQREAREAIARLEKEVSRAEARKAEPVGREAPAIAKAPVVSFILLPGLLRRGAEEQILVIPPGSDSIRLALESEFALTPGRYRAVIRNPQGVEAWHEDLDVSGTQKPPYPVEVRTQLLPEGRYTLSISAAGTALPSVPLREYGFLVKR